MLAVPISADIFVTQLLGQAFRKSFILFIQTGLPPCYRSNGCRSPERHHKTMGFAAESLFFSPSDTIRIRLEDNADNHLSPTSVRTWFRVCYFLPSVRIDFAEATIAPCPVRVEIIADFKVIRLITLHFIGKNIIFLAAYPVTDCRRRPQFERKMQAPGELHRLGLIIEPLHCVAESALDSLGFAVYVCDVHRQRLRFIRDNAEQPERQTEGLPVLREGFRHRCRPATFACFNVHCRCHSRKRRRCRLHTTVVAFRGCQFEVKSADKLFHRSRDTERVVRQDRDFLHRGEQIRRHRVNVTCR